MRFTLEEEKMLDSAQIRREAILSIVANILVIAAGAFMAGLVLRILHSSVEETLASMTALACSFIVGWGAILDISSAFRTLRLSQKNQELEEAYRQLENLNREMRSQRHDFANHIQVIYSLIEMEEPQEALTYIDRVYNDMRHVSRMLLTASPAVNALIQAKDTEAKTRGIEFAVSAKARWADEGMPVWEVCRVLGNLIDNAMDASESAGEGEAPRVELVLGEDEKSWFFSVRNNGPEIDEETKKKIFRPGFTTKRRGQGMGLFIVTRLMEQMHGTLTVESEQGNTVFQGFIPRVFLQLPEGRTETA